MKRLAFLIALLVGLPAAAQHGPISGARQLTFEGARAGEGYYAADGARMIFQSEREPGNPFYQIYVMDLETGDVNRLSPGFGKTTCGWLHPDGKRAMFASTQFDPDAKAKMQAELDFRASGKKRRYAWDYDPTFDIVATDLETGGFTRLTDAHGYDAEGAYSPDGSKIVFASNRHAYAADLPKADRERLERDPSYFMEIYVMDADGGNVRRLTDAPGYDGGPFWSADGTKITWRRFSQDGARAEIFAMNADGSGENRLTDLGVLSWAPFFHPSGDYLIFATNLQGFANFELYLVDAAGKREPVRVTDRDGFDGLATFSPDGKTLSWTSNATANRKSQIFVANWDHQAALRLLAQAKPRKQAASPVDGTEPKITPRDLRRHVEALTADAMAGRLTGTDGERLATAYVAEAFAGLGLQPAGDNGTMFQKFDFTAGVSMADGNKLSISVDGAVKALTLDREWRPLAFSRTGDAKKASVLFAGYGIVAPGDGGETPALDSYNELDPNGKWVLLWRGMPAAMSLKQRTYLSRFADMRYKASIAKSRGAAGVIFAPPPSLKTERELPRLAYEAMSGIGGLPAVAVDRRSADRMLAILGKDLTAMTKEVEAGESAGRDLIGVSASAAIALEFEGRTGRNVLARLELDGRADGLPPLIVGAHVDHLGRGETSGSLARSEEQGAIHHGADDNASGVAAMIEVAQKLKADHAAGRLRANRDIVFAAWSGEELGLLGAAHFTDSLAKANGVESLEDIVSAYINLDMVGRLRDRVIASGLGSSDIWAREIERRNAIVGLPIVTSDDTYLPTDSTSFYLAGVPILSLFTGAHTDYHSPRDTADKLNYDGMRDIARFVALVARSRAVASDEPKYVKLARPSGRSGRRMSNVFLGTIPDYAVQGQKGVPLSGVVKGGPAEKAGVKGGDVVVGLAGQKLENIYDFVRTLNGLKPGEEIEIAVERNGKRETLRITPASRN